MSKSYFANRLHLTDSLLNILHNPFIICNIIIRLAKLCCQRQNETALLRLCMLEQLLYSEHAVLLLPVSQRLRESICIACQQRNRSTNTAPKQN